jgi:hypothetical protein
MFLINMFRLFVFRSHVGLRSDEWRHQTHAHAHGRETVRLFAVQKEKENMLQFVLYMLRVFGVIRKTDPTFVSLIKCCKLVFTNYFVCFGLIRQTNPLHLLLH